MPVSYPKDLAVHVRGELLARKENPPDLRVLERLFETLYFASLKTEETQPISCRIAFIRERIPDPKPPKRVVADRWKYFPFATALDFNIPNLVKLSKAVDPWGSTLAVDTDAKNRLRIWGLIDQSVHFSKFIMKETTIGPEMPGMFQAAIQGVGEVAVYKTYVLLASLRQDQLVTKQQRVLQYGPIHAKLSGSIDRFRRLVIHRVGKRIYNKRDYWDDSLEELWISAICRILIGIQRYGHGGALLISDENGGLTPKYSVAYTRLADALVRSGVETIRGSYNSDRISENFLDFDADEIPADLYLKEAASTANIQDIENELTGCIRFLTSLSRVDGLIWVGSDLSLKAFGVEITLKKDPTQLFRSNNESGTELRKLEPTHFGMRHRSMIRYCAQNPASVGFIVSQDGDVRATTRIKNSSVLWENVRIQSVIVPRQRSQHRP